MEKKQIIRLTESDLHQIIEESVLQILNENDMEEGWFGDKWNQVKTAGNTLLKEGEGSLGQRFQNARKNWSTQGDLNGIANLRKALIDLLDKRQISPQTTVAQLVGGKYNNNKFGTMSAMVANRKAQIGRRGGQGYIN